MLSVALYNFSNFVTVHTKWYFWFPLYYQKKNKKNQKQNGNQKYCKPDQYDTV